MVGEYRIEAALAMGGMSTVYEAVDLRAQKRLALKVLHHDLCGKDDAVARFVREATVVNRIGHPNIVEVFAYGTTDDGRVYLAMELLHGETLRQRLARDLPLDEACHILVEITHALEAAHDAGIIHRDLKPDNIFLIGPQDGLRRREAPFPRVKLLDFGIAKLTAATTDAQANFGYVPAPATQNGVVIGTPCYLSPEQARCLELDARTDIYSLGVVAFEMFAGRPPFEGKTGIEFIAKHLTMRPPAPTEIKVSLPAVADKLVGSMLEKDRELRPTLRRVRELLLEIPRAPACNNAAALASSRERTTRMLATPEPPPAPRRRTRRMWIVAALIATAASIAALLTALSDADAASAPRQELTTSASGSS
jgi:eukaryotic-like serine/threonine-protein kinase